MLRNYFLIAIRHLRRERLYASINVLGLSIGIGSCLLIFLLLQHENSYDDFHERADQLFQVSMINYVPTLDGRNDEPEIGPLVPMGTPEAMADEMPAISRATSMNSRRATVLKGNEPIRELVNYVTPDFLEMFSFPIKDGHRDALTQKTDVVISETIAEKYFEGSDPLDQTMKFIIGGRSSLFTVKAVMVDPPTNTNLDFGILLPLQAMPYYEEEIANWNNSNTFVLVETEKPMSAEALNQQMQSFYDQHWQSRNDVTRENLGMSDTSALGALMATPLTQLQLSPETGWWGSGLVHGSV